LGEEYLCLCGARELMMNFFAIWQSLEQQRVLLSQQQQMLHRLSNSVAAASILPLEAQLYSISEKKWLVVFQIWNQEMIQA